MAHNVNVRISGDNLLFRGQKLVLFEFHVAWNAERFIQLSTISFIKIQDWLMEWQDYRLLWPSSSFRWLAQHGYNHQPSEFYPFLSQVQACDLLKGCKPEWKKRNKNKVPGNINQDIERIFPAKICTWPFLEITQRESPAFATINWLFLIIATHAVQPDIGPAKSAWGPWTQYLNNKIMPFKWVHSIIEFDNTLLHALLRKKRSIRRPLLLRDNKRHYSPPMQGIIRGIHKGRAVYDNHDPPRSESRVVQFKRQIHGF